MGLILIRIVQTSRAELRLMPGGFSLAQFVEKSLSLVLVSMILVGIMLCLYVLIYHSAFDVHQFMFKYGNFLWICQENAFMNWVFVLHIWPIFNFTNMPFGFLLPKSCVSNLHTNLTTNVAWICLQCWRTIQEVWQLVFCHLEYLKSFLPHLQSYSQTLTRLNLIDILSVPIQPYE